MAQTGTDLTGLEGSDGNTQVPFSQRCACRREAFARSQFAGSAKKSLLGGEKSESGHAGAAPHVCRRT